MQIAIHTIQRTGQDYQANQVPVDIIYEQGITLDPYTLSYFTQLISERETVLRGLLVTQDESNLIISRGIGIADKRLVILKEPLHITIGDTITQNLEPGKLYYVVLHADTSANIPISTTNVCLYVDRGNVEILLSDTPIQGGTDDHIHIYLTLACVRYMGQNIFRIEHNETLRFRYHDPSYSIPFVTTVVSTALPHRSWISTVLNRYRYPLNGFGIQMSRDYVQIDGGTVYVHGYVISLPDHRISVLKLIEELYAYEKRMYNTDTTDPNKLLGKQYVYCAAFSERYEFVGYRLTEPEYLLDSYSHQNLYSVPVMLIDYRTGLGPLCKSIW